MNVADKETIAFASKKLPTKSNKPVVANTKASPAVAPTARSVIVFITRSFPENDMAKCK